MKNYLTDGNCPHCGGLPINPRAVQLGDIEAFARRESPTVFTFTGERKLDWRLEAALLEDAQTQLTCSDCGLEYVAVDVETAEQTTEDRLPRAA